MTAPRSAIVGALAALAVAAPAQAAEPTWRIEQPLPAGASVPGPIGGVGALELLSPSRGILQTQGNRASPPGLWTYDGRTWQPLSTVCGADASASAIAVAGPDEFWTVSDPAAGAVPAPAGDPYPDTGTTLCHFKGGRVVASYATEPTLPTRYFAMHAGACATPSNCWFAGDYGTTGDGSRAGAFQLRWDGQSLTPQFSPQERAGTALAVQGATFVQALALGRQALTRGAATPAEPEPEPRLLRVSDGVGRFQPVPFAFESRGYGRPPDPDQNTPFLDDLELVGLSEDASGRLWLAGGPAFSGPRWGYGSRFDDGQAPSRLPVLALREPGGEIRQLRFAAADEEALAGTPNAFGQYDGYLVTDVAALPDRPGEAMLTLRTREGAGAGTPSPGAAYSRSAAFSPLVAHVKVDFDAAPGEPDARLVSGVERIDGANKGSALRVACAAADDCWLATTQGWLYHWTDGEPLPQDTDPAYGRLISTRPPDGRSPQPLPEGDAVDDSLRFAPQPQVIVESPAQAPPAPTPQTTVVRKPALIARARARTLGQRRIEVRFELRQPARVGLAGTLRGRVVARTGARRLRVGDNRIILKVKSNLRPTGLRFSTADCRCDDPVLATAAVRRGTRVRVTVTSPLAGRLETVARGRSAARRRITLAAGRRRTLIVPVRRPRPGRLLRVTFALRPAGGGAVLRAQRFVPWPAARKGRRR